MPGEILWLGNLLLHIHAAIPPVSLPMSALIQQGEGQHCCDTVRLLSFVSYAGTKPPPAPNQLQCVPRGPLICIADKDRYLQPENMDCDLNWNLKIFFPCWLSVPETESVQDSCCPGDCCGYG